MATALASADAAADLTIGSRSTTTHLAITRATARGVPENRYTTTPATTSKRSPEMPKTGLTKPKRQAGQLQRRAAPLNRRLQ